MPSASAPAPLSASIAASSSATASSRSASSESAASDGSAGGTVASSAASSGLCFLLLLLMCLRNLSVADARENLAEGAVLKEPDFGGADEFEDGEEGEDQLAARLRALEEVAHVQLAGREDHVA